MGWAIAASAGLQALGSIQQGYAGAAAAGYNASVAQNNAKIAKQNAGWSSAEGEQKFGVAGLEAQQKEGGIKVAQAANNVDVNSGSAVGVQRSQAQMSELNQSDIRSNAARQAYGYNVQAAGDIGQANLYKSQASNDIKGGWLSAGASILQGAGTASLYGGGGGGAGTGDFPQGTPEPTPSASFLGAQPSSNFSLWYNDSSLFNSSY